MQESQGWKKFPWRVGLNLAIGLMLCGQLTTTARADGSDLGLTTANASDAPLLIVKPDGQPQTTPPQQIFLPRTNDSFDSSPSTISGSGFFNGAYAVSPYHWLGSGYAPVSPVFGGVAAMTMGLAGIGPSYSFLGGYNVYNGYSGFGRNFGRYGGYGLPHGGLGSIGYGNLGYGGLGGFGMPFGGFGGMGYGGYGGYGGFGGFGLGIPGMGMGMGMGMGTGTSPEFGRLTNTRVIQTAPSKASGNYYAPSTVDSTASGSYYANPSSTTMAFPLNHQNSQPSYKPQKNYWGSSGSPFPKDLNSVPWSK